MIKINNFFPLNDAYTKISIDNFTSDHATLQNHQNNYSVASEKLFSQLLYFYSLIECWWSKIFLTLCIWFFWVLEFLCYSRLFVLLLLEKKSFISLCISYFVAYFPCFEFLRIKNLLIHSFRTYQYISLFVHTHFLKVCFLYGSYVIKIVISLT